MAQLYFLSFRDISSASTAVTAGEVYRKDVDVNTDWSALSIGGADWVPWDDVSKVFRGKRICFVLHGFNVDLQNGQKSCGPMAQRLSDIANAALAATGADMAVPVLWPGDGFIGWSYITAFGHAESTGLRFSDFLASSSFMAAEVSFISHSLGARVVLETVSKCIARFGGRIIFNTAILMAPAVDEAAFDDSKFLPVSGPGGLKRIVVLSSVQDMVLRYWFAIGDAVERALWWNYKSGSRALGRFGPRFADASPARTVTESYAIAPGLDQDHGDYLPAGGAPPAQGWQDKPAWVELFCRDVLDTAPFAQPDLRRWAADRTGEFRPGWTAKF